MDLDFLIRIAEVLAVAYFLPVFRQYKGRYFYYFLCLALSGVFSHLIIHLHRLDIIDMNQNIAIILFSNLSLFTLHYKLSGKPVRIFFFFFYIIFSFVIYYNLVYPELFYYIMFIHSLTALFITLHLLSYTYKHLSVNFIHVFLLLLEVSIILKYLSLVIDLESGVYYLSISNIFQALLAIYFIFFREDKPKLTYRFVKDEQFLKDREDTLLGFEDKY